MGVREELTKALKAVETIYWAVVPRDDDQGTAAVDDAVLAIHRTFYMLNFVELAQPHLDAVVDRPPRWATPGCKATGFVYLGSTDSSYYRSDGTKEAYDLYLYISPDHQSVAARHGNGEGDYASLPVSAVESSLTRAKLDDVVRGPLLSAYLMALHKQRLKK